MTNEEAVRELKWVKKYGFKIDKRIIGTEQIEEALGMAMEALKKQIPMKPISDNHEGHRGMKCENCGEQVWINQRYCERCGQAISWEVEDDK